MDVIFKVAAILLAVGAVLQLLDGDWLLAVVMAAGGLALFLARRKLRETENPPSDR